MRPRRLELEGFMAFRDPVEVDFGDTDLFAFTGATGSGKTSLVDAMTFALYGCVSRYDDRRLVAPAITQGKAEARVRFDFEVDGVGYTAVRVVRRTPKGATTKEARLERADGELLAGNEKELTAAVESLLGLSFEHFTTCVVLPQGEFARFLHVEPRTRQDLLVRLLDLTIYERMAAAARDRASGAKHTAENLEAQLADNAAVTDQTMAAAQSRLDAYTVLLDAVDAAAPQIEALDAAADGAASLVASRRHELTLLAAIQVPGGVDAMADELAAAETALAAAVTAEAKADDALTAADTALDALPERAALDRLLERHAQRAGLEDQRAKGAAALAEAQESAQKAALVLEQAGEQAAAASARLHELHAQHRAHVVAADLVVGGPCPVCRQTVSVLPPSDVPPDLEDAARAEAAAKGDEERTRAAHNASVRELDRVEHKLASIDDSLAELTGLLEGALSVAEAEQQLAARDEAEAAAKAARAAAKQAKVTRADGDRRVNACRANEAEQRATFDATRDTVAALGPPPRLGSGLGADWAALASWAATRILEQRAAVTEAEANAASAKAAHDAARLALLDRCAQAGVEIGERVPRDVVVDRLSDARSEVSVLGAAQEQAKRIRVEIAAQRDRFELHNAMARHLGANGFEKWMLDEAIGLLVVGATEMLLELSGGQYSLDLDDKGAGFVVVDHANADDRRSARTLSGGETFLASLALALALADQLSVLAARGGARLDSIFLDEGFGTLDPATLDTVASAIEELGAKGRLVGIISHVAALAERVPVQFEITKGPHTSTIERIDR